MKLRAGRQGSLALGTAAEKARAEETTLLKNYKAWRRRRNADLLAGPHGLNIRALVTFLRGMGPKSGRELIAIVQDAVWLRTADDDTRMVVLGLIGQAIARTREKEGLVPFDDPFPDEPPNAFVQIRAMLRVRAEPSSLIVTKAAHVDA